MSDLCRLIWRGLSGLFRSRAALEAEILGLRHQLNVLRRKSPKRLGFGSLDRFVFIGLCRLSPNVLAALKILKPETVVRWHRAGFRGRRPPSPGWKAFLRNHADVIASIDIFVVSTISRRLLYGLLILRHSRRELVWLGVTAHPSAEWTARQMTEAFGWEKAPAYIVRDRDGAYGESFIRRIRAIGIRDRPTSARSPWQNGYVERLIGSIRRDCLDHVASFGERHLRHLLLSYQSYYDQARTHLSLYKDAPVPREVRAVGRVVSVPMVGGLHHRYVLV